MFKYLTQKWKQKRGFTLMEVMVVVAILAVIAGIAIPSVINMRKNMKFTERNDYAKAIFMAAQANLTEMRSKGELSLIIPEDGSAKAVKVQEDRTPPPSTYIYTWNSEASIFDCVLPANSIDSAVRNGQIIIEYNPAAGIVYSVFYYDDDDMDLKAQYASGALTRDEEGRKEFLLGYYSVGNIDALDAQALDVYQLASSISFTNSDEALLTISVPSQTTDRTGAIVNIFEKVQGGTSGYTQRMEIALTISGENTNSFTVIGKSALVDATLGETGVVSYTTKTGSSVGAVPIVDFIFTLDSLNENENFKKIIDAASGGTANTTGFQFGDNTAITADITFYPSANDPIVMIESSTIAGINPMFHSLTQNPDTTEGAKPYILAISNARHLKNLEYFAKNHEVDSADTFIKQIDSIVFVEKQTLPANNGGGVSGNTGGSEGGNGSNSSEGNTEGASIQPLTTSDTNTNNGSGSTGTTPPETEPTTGEIAIDWDAEAGATAKFTPIDFSRLSYVPNIIGNGVKISNLRIAESGNPGSPAGLFAKLDGANIDGITLVDPDIANISAFLTGPLTNSDGTSNIDKVATTGALAGTAVDTTITNCNVIHSENYTAKEDDAFAIEGRQFVGGLVGYTAGNTTIKNCSVTVEVADTGIVSGETDNITYQLGGMVGYADGTTFENCTTTATVTATTATDLGGMAGKAINASFTGCSTEATVTGADGVLSNIGGLVGYAEDTLFTNPNSNAVVKPTVASGMNVFSSDNTKNHVGGMVGYAKGSAKDKTKFTNYSVSERATVLSNVNSCSDIGGMVGYADTVTFSNCNSNASVNGSQKVNSEGTPISDIPNNNLGGFVGTSDDCIYTTIKVTLKDRPEYAEDAGGFAGILKGNPAGDRITDLEITFNIANTDDPDVDTLANFGGVASQCTSSAAISDVEVTINGNFNNVKNIAAGAFGTMQNADVSNFKIDFRNGSIGAESAAGFTTHVGTGATVTDSYVLGTVYGSDTEKTAGFAVENSGTIQRCMAGTTLNYGYVFVNTNRVKIEDCYGWADGKVKLYANAEKEYDANYYSSYFGLKDGPMVLYKADSEKSSDITDTEALTDKWALELLNAKDENPVWENEAGGYPYPELTSFTHVGDVHASPATGLYPYALLYKDAEKSVLVKFKADGSIQENGISSSEGDPSLSSPVYYLCHRTTDKISSDNIYKQYGDNGFEAELDSYGLSNSNRLYTIYELEEGKSYSLGNNKTVQTYFPIKSASGENITYSVRSEKQFGYLEDYSDGTFVVEKSMKAAALDSFGGTLTAAGNDITLDASGLDKPLFGTLSGSVNGIKITGLPKRLADTIESGGSFTGTVTLADGHSDNLVGTLKGTLSGLTITGLKAPMVNEISGGTVTGCDVSGKIESGENVGIIAGTMSSGSIDKCNVSGSVSGSGYVGGVVGRSAGTLTNVDAVLDGVSSSNGQAGALAGYASAGTISDCTITAPEGVAFANFPKRESLHEDAQYISRYDHGAENDINIVSGTALNMVSIEGRNDTLITEDVSVSKCKLNNSTVPITRVYYYHKSDLQCSSPDKAFAFITMEKEDLKFNDLYSEDDTVYYIEVADKVYEEITSVTFSPDSPDDENTTYTFTYKTDSLGEKSIHSIKLSDRTNSSGLTLYTKTTSDPNKHDDSYLIFNQSGTEILIYNEAGFAWVVYDVKYYSHMIWVCQDGIWTNAYMPDGKVTVGDAVGFTTANLTYGDKTTVCQLYPVTAYRTVKRVDSANILDGSNLT